MRIIAALMILFMIASCGADGEPVRPTVNAGVRITPNGVSPSVSIGTRIGPLHVGIGL